MNKKLVFLACASLLAIPSLQAQANEKKDVNLLKEDLKEVEAKKDTLEKEISEIHQYIDETEKVIMGIQNNLNDTNTKITNTENKIKQLSQNIAEKQNEINSKIIELNEQKQKLGQTISFMYENKDFGFFQFFFQTEELSDFLKTYDFINIVADENEKIYKQIQKQEADLKTQKATLENDKKSLETSKISLEQLKAQQITQKAEQDLILNQHKDREAEMLQKLKEEEDASNQIMAEINKALQGMTPNAGTEEIPLDPEQKLASPMAAGTYYISSVYGYRVHPVLGYSRLHNGSDFAAPMGTPIYSAGTGTVLFSGPSNGYGNWIVIQHDNGLLSIYGHMESNNLYVIPGQRVMQGQLISKVGNSGLSSGPHLHFSVATEFNGSSFTYIDPLTVLQ